MLLLILKWPIQSFLFDAGRASSSLQWFMRFSGICGIWDQILAKKNFMQFSCRFIHLSDPIKIFFKSVLAKMWSSKKVFHHKLLIFACLLPTHDRRKLFSVRIFLQFDPRERNKNYSNNKFRRKKTFSPQFT